MVEILETVEPDREVIAACRKLKQAGYLIALDDFIDEERYKPLVEIADILKIDFLTTKKDEQKRLIERYAPRGIRLAAEKVETRETLQEAMEMGYSYFQGFFFSKPTIISGRRFPASKSITFESSRKSIGPTSITKRSKRS
ncbi:MAG: EAL domain-containing protein [Candidatus Manganitrophus sp.]|nr:MAG: EAL domain-containing protein [Candidatus Manganitrophus sp.]